MNIPEKAVEAAAGSVRCGWSIPMEDHPLGPDCDLCRKNARHMLEAATPFIQAAALHEAADNYRHYETPNARLYLRARADRIEESCD